MSEEEQESDENKVVEPKNMKVVGDNKHPTRFSDTILASFPLRVKRDDIRFHTKPILDIKTNAREITFIANYKKLKVICASIINVERTHKAKMIETRTEHEWKMSNTLGICRNMATYIDRFKMRPSELNVEYLKDIPSDPVWFFIKPYYEYGTLRNYLDDKTKKGE